MGTFLDYLYRLPAVAVAVILHGYAQRLVFARVSLRVARKEAAVNPLKFIDPLGAICMLFCGGYGWGNPPPAPAYMLHRRKAVAAAYLFPAACNLVFGLCMGALCALAAEVGAASAIYYLLGQMAVVNVCFGLFNIVPIPPLDGGFALPILLTANAQMTYRRIEWVLQCVLCIAIISGFAAQILNPAMVFLLRLLGV